MEPNVKILIATHQPAKMYEDSIFQPINGGRTLLQEKYKNGEIDKNFYDWMTKNTISDNDGDNISNLNNTHNEMTIIYWAYKNYDKLTCPDYIGFEHYRRNFIFKDFEERHGSWAIDYRYPTKEYYNHLNRKKENILKYLNKYECLHSQMHTDLTVYEQYKISKYHDILDLDMSLDFIKNNFPSYYDSAYKYVNGKNNYFCNMFIMKKHLFFEYCQFIFPILDYIASKKDFEYLSTEEKRLFVSERLTGMFIQNLIDRGISCCPLNITLLKNTSIEEDIYPAFDDNNIPIVFSVDDNYAPYLSVTLASLIQNTSLKYNYDIVILYTNLTERNKEILSSLASKKNVSIRFSDITPFLESINKDNLYIEIHVSLATYYRFFIPSIFKNYAKIIYLDSDLIINHDIAELYFVSLNDNWIAAAQDIRESIPTKYEHMVSNQNWRHYVKEVLGLKNPYNYFQAGVLLFDIQKAHESNLEKLLFKRLQEIKKPILSDQDILNSVCKDHVQYIPTEWNIEWQIPFEFKDYKKILPNKLCEQYETALKKKFIIHYASSIKPWSNPDKYLSYLWWNYAKLSPYYHILIKRLTSNPKIEVIPQKCLCKAKKKYVFYKILQYLSFGKRKEKIKKKKKYWKNVIKSARFIK